VKKRTAAKSDSVTGRAGNYAAPIDTTGMDPVMKQTLTKPKRAASGSPLSKLLRTFGVNID
jgi:hypothetical protein